MTNKNSKPVHLLVLPKQPKWAHIYEDIVGYPLNRSTTSVNGIPQRIETSEAIWMCVYAHRVKREQLQGWRFQRVVILEEPPEDVLQEINLRGVVF